MNFLLFIYFSIVFEGGFANSSDAASEGKCFAPVLCTNSDDTSSLPTWQQIFPTKCLPTSRNPDYERDISMLKESSKKVNSKVANLSTELANQSESGNDARNILDKRISNLTEKILKLQTTEENSSRVLDERISDLGSRIQDFYDAGMTSANSLDAAISNLRAELQKVSDNGVITAADLGRNITALDFQIRDVKTSTTRALESEVLGLRSQLGRIENTVAQQRNDLNALSGRLDAEMNELKGDVSRHDGMIQSLQRALVRLRGTTDRNRGRVEVLYDGEWGTVCDDDWDGTNTNADVTCRMLGYTRATKIYSGGTGRSTLAQYGQGTGKIWLDGLQCGDTDSYIQDCKHAGWGIHDCDHGEDVSIDCA